MPLGPLTTQGGGGDISHGHVVSGLYNGQYRVMHNGRQAVAISQTGTLRPGTTVTIARTAAGLVVVAAGDRSASTSVEVTIDG